MAPSSIILIALATLFVAITAQGLEDVSDISCHKGIYLVAGASSFEQGGAAVMYTSTNGVNFTANLNFLGAAYGPYALQYNDDMWIASDPNGHVYTSTDAVNWTPMPNAPVGYFVIGNGVYLGVDAFGDGSSNVYQSTDLKTWKHVSTVNLQTADTLFYDPIAKAYIASGGPIHDPYTVSSRDGITWTEIWSDAGWTYVVGLSFNEQYIAVVGYNEHNEMALFWTDHKLDNKTWSVTLEPFTKYNFTVCKSCNITTSSHSVSP